jgi:YD repeat-containing protein
MKRNIYNVVFILLLYSISHLAFSQGTNPIPPTPLSPEGALLHKFVDIPVGYFTGTAAIQIPLYEIKLSSLSIPITLKYHSSGLKVDQTSSSVGWGWSLEAGGMITFNQVGLNDFGPGGFVTDLQDINNLSYTEKTKISGTVVNQPIPTLDGQPDIYYYSFPGKSGRFIYDANGIPNTIPYAPIAIAKATYFKITDESGNVFEFDTICNARTWNNQDPGVYNESSEYYLSKITTLNGEEVYFEYEYEQMQTWYNIESLRFVTDSNPCMPLNLPTSDVQCIVQNTGIWRIKTIRSNLGHKVEFGYSSSAREDCNSVYTCKSLKCIKVFYQSEEEPIKQFNTSTTYFNSFNASTDAYKNKRLKLDSIEEVGIGSHSFEYYNADKVAHLHSFSQDLYGYNNGKSNFILVPSYSGLFQGATRTPDFQYLIAGTLKTVRYPTGGKSQIVYEINQDSNSAYSGGLRVHSISEFNDSVKVKERYFHYSDPITSPIPIFSQNRTSYAQVVFTCSHDGETYNNCTNCLFCPINYIEITSHTKTGLNGISGGSIGYRNVVESIGENGTGGKTEYQFHGQNIGGNSGLWPYRPESERYANDGLLLKKTIFNYLNGTYYLVLGTINTYDTRIMGNYVNGATIPVLYPECGFCFPIGCSVKPAGLNPVQYNSYISLSMNLVSTEERNYKYLTPITEFNTSSTYISNTQEFEYDSEYHNFRTSVTSNSSDGEQKSLKYKYAQDYTLYTGTMDQMSSAIKFMRNSNLVNYPIEIISKTHDNITAADLNLFRISSDSLIVLDKQLRCELPNPIDDESLIISMVNSANNFTYDSKYKIAITFDSYNEIGQLQQYHSIDDIFRSYIWGYGGTLCTAQIENAALNSVFYTGFEYDSGTSIIKDQSKAKTGQFYKSLSATFHIPKSFPSGDYVITYYWKSILNNPWELVTEFASNTTTITLDKSSGYIDDVRCYPVNSLMTTYTYNPLVGMTSKTDQNNKTTYYEYDPSRRLIRIRDHNGYILRNINYNLKHVY